MHPIIIMSYDRSPAIKKAIEILEDAGLEVRLLNTNSARLADFLGALAGDEDDDDKEDSKKDAPVVDTEIADAAKDAADAFDDDAAKPEVALECIIDGEKVKVLVVEGTGIMLHPSSITAGARTVYSINESQFAFWPSAISNAPITEEVELKFENVSGHFEIVLSEEAQNPPVLKIGRNWLMEADYPKNSWAIMKGYHFEKGSVNLEDIRKERLVTAQLCMKNDTGRLMWILTSGDGYEVGHTHDIHNDQTLRPMGSVKVIATVKLGETAAEDKITGKAPEGKDITKLSAPVYVFK